MTRPRYMITTCHPDRKHVGLGLCQECYSKEYRTKNKDIIKAKDVARNNREQTPEYKNQKYYALIKRKYELSKEQFLMMVQEQKGACKICEQAPATNKRLHVDHNHKTGKVRGLLCAQCNWYVGKIDKSNGDLLWNLIWYGGDNGWKEI